ncbi:MAG: response regulator transcription factor [Chloroflexi bacterium]|nr:response regulator transcription factor [Chloroflexota bacterium]
MTQDKAIRIIIADDHKMVREGLLLLLEEFNDLEIIADVGNGELAYNHCRESCPDVVLMDLKMPHMDGVEATRLIRGACPNTQVITLTTFDDEEQVQDALQAGAIGYLLKDVSAAELADAIRRAHKGETTLAPAAAKVLIAATTGPPALGHNLTDREREVLELMIQGLNNREIGEELVISSSTVKNHVSSILSKLETTSRTQAVALAVEHKIIDA